jgi:hypothetical protein
VQATAKLPDRIAAKEATNENRANRVQGTWIKGDRISAAGTSIASANGVHPETPGLAVGAPATLIATDNTTAVGAAKLINQFVGCPVKGLEAVTFFAAAFAIATAVAV